MPDLTTRDSWIEACDRLEGLLLRYTDSIGGQITACQEGDIPRANRMAATGEALLAECGRAAQRLTTTVAPGKRMTPRQRERYRALQRISATAQATAQRLGVLLSSKRAKLLAEIRHVESPEASAGPTVAPTSPKLINIKT